MVKSSCSEMQNGIWDEKEEEKMVTCGSKKQCAGNWTGFSKRSGQKKIGKSNVKIDPSQKCFTPQEEELVIQLHSAIGSRWPIIAQQLPGRTDNDVKILWNSKLRKKLSAMGIDPVTHKPFSQILADYGNIGAFPKAPTRFSSLSKDLKNAIVLKTEQSLQSFIPSHFSSSAPKQELSDHPHIDLYSQLQAVNFMTEASNYARSENTGQELSSFSWSDLFLDDGLLGQDGNKQENDGGVFVEFDECIGGKAKCGEIEEKYSGGVGFEGSSASDSSSFVDAMLESQDAMFSQISCFPEEQFYY